MADDDDDVTLINADSSCTRSLSVKVLSNHLHLLAHCDRLKAFRVRVAQFFQNSKIQKITVNSVFFEILTTDFIL